VFAARLKDEIQGKPFQNQHILCRFIETMSDGSYEEQLARTQTTQEPVYYAVALFGKKETLDPLTKRLSLYL